MEPLNAPSNGTPNDRSQDSGDDVEILSVEPCHRGFFSLDRYRLRHRRFDGTWSDAFNREMFQPPGAVAVLPYDPARDRLVLVEQFRLGAHLTGRPAWLIEVVGGMAEPGRTAEQVAHSEVAEEAGLTVLDLAPVAAFLPSPGTSTERIEMFCARVDSAGAGGVHGLAEEHENIRVRIVPAGEVPALLESGRIENAYTLIALQWFLLNRDRLSRLWAPADRRPASGRSGP